MSKQSDCPFSVRARYFLPSGYEVRFTGVAVDMGQHVATFEYVLRATKGRRTALGESVTLARNAWPLVTKAGAA